MQTPGRLLQTRREELGKSLQLVSQETKIQERFLKLIEADDYSKFDSGVFVSGFIKIYSDYLELDVNKLLALYRRISEEPTKDREKKKKVLSLNPKTLLTPLNLSIALIAAFLLVVVSFVSSQYKNFQTAPNIEIEQPETGTTVQTNSVKILGITDVNATLKINGNEVKIDKKGNFTSDITLIEGENVIKFEAKSTTNPDLITFEGIVINYVKPEIKPKQKKIVTNHKAYLEIIGEVTWIQLSIDDQQVFAQGLNPGTTEEFEVKKSLELTTGKPTTTTLYMNGKQVKLSIDTVKGIGYAQCKVENGEINCSQ